MRRLLVRSFLLSAALLAAAALTVLTPGRAPAQNGTGYLAPYTYGGYYFSPGYYYSPSPYYAAGAYYGGYNYVAPVVTYSYTVRYSAPVAPAYITTPDASAFRPIYSGPQYFQGYGPNRLWIYP
jgi:hypothetical protein